MAREVCHENKKNTICRDLVRRYVFGFIAVTDQNLLVNVPKTIVRRVSAHAKSEGSLEDAERIVHDEISRRLRMFKLAVLASLRD